MNTLYKDSKSTSRSCYGIASLRFPWPKMLNEVWGGGGEGVSVKNNIPLDR